MATATKQCPECGQEVSDYAPRCPCGYQFNKPKTIKLGTVETIPQPPPRTVPPGPKATTFLSLCQALLGGCMLATLALTWLAHEARPNIPPVYLAGVAVIALMLETGLLMVFGEAIRIRKARKKE